jgi:hypothetical protein
MSSKRRVISSIPTVPYRYIITALQQPTNLSWSGGSSHSKGRRNTSECRYIAQERLCVAIVCHLVDSCWGSILNGPMNGINNQLSPRLQFQARKRTTERQRCSCQVSRIVTSIDVGTHLTLRTYRVRPIPLVDRGGMWIRPHDYPFPVHFLIYSKKCVF